MHLAPEKHRTTRNQNRGAEIFYTLLPTTTHYRT